MSMQEVRNDIIRENIPKLIKALTQFDDTDENARRCEIFAWSTIRNHRHLSTNSHEVRRKIEGIQEKFDVENYPEFSKHLGALCDEVIHHPAYVSHYEVDVQWSILDFLFTMAYNPTGALRSNQQKIDLSQPIVVPAQGPQHEQANELEYWRNAMQEDFIPVTSYSDSENELSDWSDGDDHPADDSVLLCSTKTSENAEEENNKSVTLLPNLPPLKPPVKELPYTFFDSAHAKERLYDTVQNSWWQANPPAPQAAIESKRWEANFSVTYTRFLSDTSNNLIRFEIPATAHEHGLLRELLWMFHSPQTCKFFHYTPLEVGGDGVIRIQKSVTVPSVTVDGLVKYLEQYFLPPIRMMHALRQFVASIYANQNVTPPKTVECYAANLRTLLKPIQLTILEYERRLMHQQAGEINTLIQLHEQLRPSLSTLECLYEVHQQVILPLHQQAAHISSAHLLAGLLHCHLNSCAPMEANLAISLFLASVKIFCIIIDTWWCEGRLDDWQQEFPVECDANQNVQMRLFSKDKERGFFVPTNVAKLISGNRFVELLLSHTLEAGCTLNLLYKFNRISDLRRACAGIEGKLYNVFLAEVLQRAALLQAQLKGTPLAAGEQHDSGFVNEAAAEEVDGFPLAREDNKLINQLTTTDEFLLLAFTSDEDEHEQAADETDHVAAIEDFNGPAEYYADELNALAIFKRLQQTAGNILPLEEVILTSLTRILQTRIASANSFVTRLYNEEFDILSHLRNMRKVLLLEASDVMHQFYVKLFHQIESAHAWANPFLLTIQLDDILCAKFPEMMSLFRLDIKPSLQRTRTEKVLEAVEQLFVTYNFNRELAYIITPKDLQQYNKVFRFLLKVKWGLMTLENLQFPRAHKRRQPYAKLQISELMMRRLEQLRFWMLYAMQSVHFHLMTHVLQSMGEQLDEKIVKCPNLREMERTHQSYIDTVCEHCFLEESLSAVKLGVEQLLNLTLILRLEWNQCLRLVDMQNPLAIASDDNEYAFGLERLAAETGDGGWERGGSTSETEDNGSVSAQIDTIELTYIRCHQYLARRLRTEVYLRRKSFLSGLSEAFNTSLPH